MIIIEQFFTVEHRKEPEKMKALIKYIVGYFGYRITKKRKAVTHEKSSTAFSRVLLSLLSCTDEIRIVHVGANDGCTGDPLYDFIRRFPTRTQILLVEPQEYLIPYLKENYSFHEKSFVYNGAIGPNGFLKLFSVDQSVWKDLDVDYAKGWPEYRAPTGVTSSNRERVHKWLRNHSHFANELDIDNAIRESTVPSIQILDLLRKMDLPESIDVLQIDAEGYDDQVIYNSSIDTLMPKIIHFEAKHLPLEKLDRLSAFLEDYGYFLSRHGDDALAILPIPMR